MQTLRSGYIYMIDAHCTEPNEKSIFKLRLITFTIFKYVTLISKPVTDQKNMLLNAGEAAKYTGKMHNVMKRIKNKFLVFEIWSFKI